MQQVTPAQRGCRCCAASSFAPLTLWEYMRLDSSGSETYICCRATPWTTGRYRPFGRLGTERGRDEIPLARWESAELEEGLVERVRSELSTARYAS